MPLYAHFLVRANAGEPVTAMRNQFNQVLDAATGHLLSFTPDEMQAIPVPSAPPWPEDAATPGDSPNAE